MVALCSCSYLAPLWRYSASNVGRTDVDMERKKEEGKEKKEGEEEGKGKEKVEGRELKKSWTHGRTH